MNVIAWLFSMDASTLYLSAMTLLEIEPGIVRMERCDAAQGAWLRSRMTHHVAPEFLDRTLPVDAAVALRCALLHVPDPRCERDALIVATALVHGMTVVTRNVADFERTGVPVLDPWGGG